MSQKTITVRGVTLGQGKPKICIPIVGTTAEQILSQAQALKQLPVDIVEWRCDWFADIFDLTATTRVLQQLRQVLDSLPLLMTFRTAAEGGEKEIDPATYVTLLSQACSTGCIDLLDVELMMGPQVFSQLLPIAERAGIAVIASNHDFNKTPEAWEILSRLSRMQSIGAHIAKIAVMPQTPQDVITLLDATLSASGKLEIPIITMSMSATGVISRLCGEVFGSAMTFGAAGQASAPGQIPAQQLARILDILHEAT